MSKPEVFPSPRGQGEARYYSQAEIIEAIQTLWKKEFGPLSDDKAERDGHFVCGFVIEALSAYNRGKEPTTQKETRPAILTNTNRLPVTGNLQPKADECACGNGNACVIPTPNGDLDAIHCPCKGKDILITNSFA